jgi:hypothetical protein
MLSTRTTGSPSAVLAQFFADNMGLRQPTGGSALPRLPIIRFRWTEGFRGFTGSLSLWPVELLVPLADLTKASPSQPGLLLPSFPTGRSPFPRLDMTTVVTEQTPPMGLTPIGTSASIAARSVSLRALRQRISALFEHQSGHTAGREISEGSHFVSMRLECLPGLKQRLQAGKNTWPSIGASSVSGVILGPLVMRHCYFGGFGLGQQFDSCA